MSDSKNILNNLLNTTLQRIKIAEKEELREKYLENERKKLLRVAQEREVNKEIANKFKQIDYVWKEVTRFTYIQTIVCSNCMHSIRLHRGFFSIEVADIKDQDSVHKLTRLESIDKNINYPAYYTTKEVPLCVHCNKSKIPEWSTDFSKIIATLIKPHE